MTAMPNPIANAKGDNHRKDERQAANKFGPKTQSHFDDPTPALQLE
jgi:hypothetical protein